MKKVLLIVVAVVVLGGMIAVGVVKSNAKTGTEVFVAEAEGGDITSVVSASGEIQPRTKVNISSQVYGTIVAIPVREGQLVRKGQVLLKIDPEQYQSEVNSLSASVRMARTEIESEETALATRTSQLRRAEALRKDGVLPEDEYDTTKLAHDSSRIRLKALREQVAQAEAALAKANDQLAKTTLYAPMDGKVVTLNTEVGEQVIVGTTNIPGSVMMVIADMSEVLAEVRVDETEVVKVAVGQPVSVTVDAVENATYHGTISEIRNSAEKRQEVNVFGVKVLLSDPDTHLRPGMSAKARVEIERRKGVVRVPIQAVLERTEKQIASELETGKKTGTKHGGKDAATAPASADADGAVDGSATLPASIPKPAPETGKKSQSGGPEKKVQIVYVLKDGKAVLTRVTTGIADDKDVEVTSGLSDGDKVVTGPYRDLRKLKTGSQVIEKQEEAIVTEGESGVTVEVD